MDRRATPMKMGAIASPRRCDAAAETAIKMKITRRSCQGHAPTFGLRRSKVYGILCHRGLAFKQSERMPMPTRNVVLTERQEELLETLVKSGRYQNASEVLRDGLRLVEQREAEDASKLKALRAAARAGVGALDQGDFKEFGNIEELQTYLNDLSEKVISRTAE
jgi:antitoxin ParD1/3/4